MEQEQLNGLCCETCGAVVLPHIVREVTGPGFVFIETAVDEQCAACRDADLAEADIVAGRLHTGGPLVHFPAPKEPMTCVVLCAYCGEDLGRPGCKRCNEWVEKLLNQGNTTGPPFWEEPNDD